MKKILVPIFTLMFLFGSLTAAFAEPQGLDYKKFGSIATAIVTADYPGQQVVEYKYEGREKAAENKVTDSFRFEVMVNGKKQFVIVRVTHDNQLGKDLTITLEEKR